jgi:hypothetical protein
MNLSLQQIIVAIEDAKYIPADKKESVLIRLRNLKVIEETDPGLAKEVEELLDLEAIKSDENVSKAEKELAKVQMEIEKIEEKQAPLIQEKVAEDFEKMDQVLEDHKQAVSKIEGDFEKGIEKETGKADKSQADDIRKKLGLA